MVANDMALDPGIGICGKEGQGVPASAIFGESRRTSATLFLYRWTYSPCVLPSCILKGIRKPRPTAK